MFELSFLAVQNEKSYIEIEQGRDKDMEGTPGG
jgi:hypothetical protein